MYAFAFLLLCIQACLIQDVYSQCGCGNTGLGVGYGANLGPVWGAGYGANIGAGWGLAGLGTGLPCGYGNAAAYGGIGEGTIAAVGDLGVQGYTVVGGQVPVIGAVQFAGDVPAAGSVSIAGNCGCGCGVGAGYVY